MGRRCCSGPNYIASELKEPADLDVAVGTATAVLVALPANQVSSGQQGTVPIEGKIGEVNLH